MLKQIQKTILKILEEELMTVLALLLVATGIFLVRAQSDIGFYLTVYPPGGSITVTSPNGGETWTVGTTAAIAWTTLGPIDDVKIELQRTSGGSWESIIDSTTNDGSYSWPVTAPDTSQALIKISKVGDDTVNDTSNAVFTIKSPAIIGGRGRSGGGGGEEEMPGTPPPPAAPTLPPEQPTPAAGLKLIDYMPKMLSYDRATAIMLYGYNFPADFQIKVKGEDGVFVSSHITNNKKVGIKAGMVLETIQYVFPAKTLPQGEAVLTIERNGQALTPPLSILVYNSNMPINLRAQVAQKTINVTATSSQPISVTVQFKNLGQTTWNHWLQPLQIGTAKPHDRQSRFIHQDWPYNNRAVKANLLTEVKTNQTLSITFPIQAPEVKRTTYFTENFALVADGLAWIPGSDFSVRITVKPQPTATAPTTKTAPSTGGIAKPAAPQKTGSTTPVAAIGNTVISWWTGIKSSLTKLFSSLAPVVRK